MRLLLDTHTWIWFVEDNPALSLTARTLIEDGENDLLFSVASVWEMAIKVSTGKLALFDREKQPRPFDPFVADQLRVNRIDLLPIVMEHTVLVSTLPYHHRDPFDRMLAAQSLAEQVPLVSVDAVFDSYGVIRIW